MGVAERVPSLDFWARNFSGSIEYRPCRGSKKRPALYYEMQVDVYCAQLTRLI